MDMNLYTETLAKALQDAASLGDQTTQEVSRRLVVAIEPSLRLTALQMLTEVAEEVSAELDSTRVSVVMNGPAPHLQVIELPPPPPSAPVPGDQAPGEEPQGDQPTSSQDDEAEVRTTLRLPAALKRKVEAAAQAQGRSVNAWLVEAVREVLSWDDEDGGYEGQEGSYWGPSSRPPRAARTSAPTLNGWFA